MNYFLFLVIIALCGGGYFEYTEMQTIHQQALSTLQAKSDQLEAENKQLKDDKDALVRSLMQNQPNVAYLSAPVQAIVKEQMQVQQQGDVEASRPGGLGTIVTMDGKTYQDCQQLKVDEEGLTVSYTGGITKIYFSAMSPEMQKKYGYDPHQAEVQTAAELRYQQDQKNAAAQSAGSAPVPAPGN